MALSGYFSEYSLAEIFQFIQQGQKTGLLSITPNNDSAQCSSVCSYIWCLSGRIVAHARDLSQLGLISMIAKREWITNENLSDISQKFKRMSEKGHVERNNGAFSHGLLMRQSAFHASVLTFQTSSTQIDIPLGSYLKYTGSLDSEQLQLLFHAQVLQPVCGLFKLANAQFIFDEKSSLPYSEMTGLSINTCEASLLGLRVLRDWSIFKNKLPAPEFGLQRLSTQPPDFKLDTQETQIWGLANGDMTITQIAQETDLALTKVQQICFRLAAVGLLKEVILKSALPVVKKTAITTDMLLDKTSISKPALSKSFLSNLTGFLKKRV